jgi:hypothetical protein
MDGLFAATVGILAGTEAAAPRTAFSYLFSAHAQLRY